MGLEAPCWLPPLLISNTVLYKDTYLTYTSTVHMYTHTIGIQGKSIRSLFYSFQFSLFYINVFIFRKIVNFQNWTRNYVMSWHSTVKLFAMLSLCLSYMSANTYTYIRYKYICMGIGTYNYFLKTFYFYSITATKCYI